MTDRKKIFFEGLSKKLNLLGFQHLKSRNGFVKKNITEEFCIEFQTWPQFIQISPSYIIYVKSIEDIKKEAFGKSYIRIGSVGNDLTQLIINKVPVLSWTDTEENIVKAIEYQFGLYLAYGVDFFNDFSRIDYLDEVLNTDSINSIRNLGINPKNKIYLSVITAFLNRNPNLINILKENEEKAKMLPPGALDLEQYISLRDLILLKVNKH